MLVATPLSNGLHGNHGIREQRTPRTWKMGDDRARTNRYSTYSIPTTTSSVPATATMDSLMLPPDADPNSLLYASPASFAAMHNHHHHHQQQDIQMADYIPGYPQLDPTGYYSANPGVQPYLSTPNYYSATSATTTPNLQANNTWLQHPSQASSSSRISPQHQLSYQSSSPLGAAGHTSPTPSFDYELDLDVPSSPSTSTQHSNLGIPTRHPSTSSTHSHTSHHNTSNSKDLSLYGTPHPTLPNTWSCAYPGCTSPALFRRGCDLRKHYNRHRKHLFCRIEGCPQANSQNPGAGFSSKKDRDRHEAKHNPGIACEWAGEGCTRVFSRVDNMKDHVRRIHLRVN
ncbi:hypothetical protein BJX63DRAFT_50299 [Aspergillus granulosus]|uniref:C2H2-type domain-containing protein n=1 Tax=Aspergillus granulosus TaxID=176169 RepID=A0ABR4GY82_9EURO